MTCKNCSEVFKGHYCNNCGQSAETHKLNFHFLWDEIQHGLLHFDEGILYTSKQLFVRPGHSVREFIEGKRVKHFKPISLVLLFATIYGFLYHYFHIVMIFNSDGDSSTSKINYTDFNEWVGTHYAWITLLTIPLYTIGTSIAFRKQGYNLVEYFILNTFKASQRLLVHILLFPILYHFNGSPHLRILSIIFYIIDVFLIYWTNEQFFNKLSFKKTFILSLLSQLIFLASFIFIIYIVEVIYESL